MDVRMPVLDGIEATRRIIADPATAAFGSSFSPRSTSTSTCYGALRAGASGFLLKDTTPEDLLARDPRRRRRRRAARAAGHPPVIAEFALRPRRGPPDRSCSGSLTEREVEVLAARRPPGCPTPRSPTVLVVSPLRRRRT